VIEMVRFRGKRLDNGKWVDGCRIEDGHGNIYIGFLVDLEAKPIALARQNGKTANRFKPMGFYLVDSSTVGMGVEIEGKWYFAGDKVKCLDMNDEWYESEIRWNGGALTIDVQCCDYDYTAIGWALENDIQEIEIIGTKWDNPELLGGRNEQKN
jgi:hypothetical protein